MDPNAPATAPARSAAPPKPVRKRVRVAARTRRQKRAATGITPVGLRPEDWTGKWARVAAVCRAFGIRVSRVYEGIHRGVVAVSPQVRPQRVYVEDVLRFYPAARAPGEQERKALELEFQAAPLPAPDRNTFLSRLAAACALRGETAEAEALAPIDRANPTLKQVAELAQRLRVDPAWLAFGPPYPAPQADSTPSVT